jgi:trehalose-phosphatase
MRDLPLLFECLDELEQRVGERGIALFLDYDGTLAPIVSEPDAAAMSPGMREALALCARRLPVAVVSGRDREDVARRVGLDGIHCAGSHGLDISGPDGAFEHPAAVASVPGLDRAEEELRARLAGLPGALVERKRFTIAAHSRMVEPADRDRVGAAVAAAATAAPGLRVTAGKEVLEIRPEVDWDKGDAVRWLLGALGLGDTSVVPLYVGDDLTDEDAFRALRARGHGIGVLVGAPDGEGGNRTSLADYRVPSPAEVERLLRHLA